MIVLVINSGSSSLKVQLLDTAGGQALAKGLIERVGSPEVPDHAAALHLALENVPLGQVGAVGHRVVHGGERFVQPTLLTPKILADLEPLTSLAPLHNPPALASIGAALEALPGVPNVAVFDTAFHATLPPEAYLYAVPHNLYEQHGVRRYGFHGISHAYVARRAAHILGRPLDTLRLITLHLGNGASACAVAGGISVDTSMGFTPLEGLVMGTRSGDLDPALALWLAQREGAARAEDLLNRESGLKGLSGVSSDMRDVHAAREAGDPRALMALKVTLHRLKKYVGAYAAVLGSLDALVFTGGVGEHDAWIRAELLKSLKLFGFQLDAAANARHATRVTAGAPAALVIPTDEEGEIARQVAGLLNGVQRPL